MVKGSRKGSRKHHIVQGDRVKVIRGNYRELEGTVLRVLKDSDRVVVEGVNMRKHHQRPTMADPEGGIKTFEAPVHISNVMLIDPGTGEPTRVRVEESESGVKERISVKSGNPVPKP